MDVLKSERGTSLALWELRGFACDLSGSGEHIHHSFEFLGFEDRVPELCPHYQQLRTDGSEL